METTGQKNIFRTLEAPLHDARRRRLPLDFDEEIFLILDTYARRAGLTFAALIDQEATRLAHQVCTAAYVPGAPGHETCGFDRSDLIEGFRENIDGRSIPAARVDCGKVAHEVAREPPAKPAPETAAPAGPADPETERAAEILGYYQALTGNRIKAADHAKLKLIFDLPDLVIQVGILHALCYATRPIGSFAYCVKAMENFLDPGIDLERVCNALIEKLLTKRKCGQLVLPLEGEKLLIGDFER